MGFSEALQGCQEFKQSRGLPSIHLSHSHSMKTLKLFILRCYLRPKCFFVELLPSLLLIPLHVSPGSVIIILVIFVILVITSFVILVILTIFIIVAHYHDFHQDHKQDSAGLSASTKLS